MKERRADVESIYGRCTDTVAMCLILDAMVQIGIMTILYYKHQGCPWDTFYCPIPWKHGTAPSYEIPTKLVIRNMSCACLMSNDFTAAVKMLQNVRLWDQSCEN